MLRVWRGFSAAGALLQAPRHAKRPRVCRPGARAERALSAPAEGRRRGGREEVVGQFWMVFQARMSVLLRENQRGDFQTRFLTESFLLDLRDCCSSARLRRSLLDGFGRRNRGVPGGVVWNYGCVHTKKTARMVCFVSGLSILCQTRDRWLSNTYRVHTSSRYHFPSHNSLINGLLRINGLSLVH